MKYLASLALLILMPVAALAAPFGLKEGETFEQLSKLTTLKKVAAGVYETSKLTDGNIAFNEYLLVITPQQGLCKIIAWTPQITSSSNGEGVQESFSNLFTALSAKYGTGDKKDFLDSGSIWNNPNDWMMALAEKERVLVAFWIKGNKSTLPDDIDGIKLEAHGVSSNRARIELGYELANFNSCAAWLKAQRNSSL